MCRATDPKYSWYLGAKCDFSKYSTYFSFLVLFPKYVTYFFL